MTDELVNRFFARPLHETAAWLNGHGLIAWLLFIVLLVALAVPKCFDSFDILVARVLVPLSKTFRFRRLVRSATRADVRGNVNRAVGKLSKELPRGWVSDLDLRWVNNETKEQFFENNKIVVRVRPQEKQDANFVTIVHLFLKQALFGRVGRVIPAAQRMAAILYFGDRISAMRGESTASAFGELIFEPEIEGEKKILSFYQRYSDLDAKGFFTGPYLREIQHVANEVRATKFRQNMASEMNQALTHLEEFCAAYDRSQKGGEKIAPSFWHRQGIMTQYALLLVANPNKAMVDEDGTGYVSRAELHRKNGARRLYVLGSASQKEFARRVIRQIEDRTEYVLEQEFELYRDYRGNPGGVGALFIVADSADE